MEKAVLRPEGENHQAVVDFVIKPPFVVEQALEHGVSLYFIGEFSLIHPRWYWLNETIAKDSQIIKLSYNALTRQYRLSYGTLFQNFSSLDDALPILGHRVFGAVPSQEFKPGARYIASARLRLDLDQLPKPLQINALINSDWALDSEWYQWNASASLPAQETAGEDKE